MDTKDEPILTRIILFIGLPLYMYVQLIIWGFYTCIYIIERT